MTIPEKLAELQKLKNTYREHDKKAKAAKAEHDDYQRALFDEMRDAGLLTVKTDNGTFSAKSTVYASVQDLDAFVEWCKQMDLDEEFLRTKEESARLNEVVRAALDNGEELPPGVSFYAREYISITEN